MKFRIAGPLFAAAALTLGSSAGLQAQQNAMTFFVASAGLGKGGDLGGLAGADAQCQSLAQAAGAGSRTWRAYLSTSAAGGAAAVNARDRIGRGPWVNAKGEQIATSVDDLHSAANKISKETALTEKGGLVNGVGDPPPNQHDMITGSQADGTAFAGDPDRTCGNWTSSADGAGGAMVGHTDRRNPSNTEAGKSWNTSHVTPGCAQANLVRVGGAGAFYCFASN